ncbi:MAG: type ISP restriction/modification enzyme [Deltaproteobacteria bacterium]|nr:type ISP restriction/modification enzyme [Deltaproteobacteria bacterium]
MPALNLKPTHKAVKAYFDELKAVAHLDFYDEGAVSPAFAELLRHCGHQSRLTLVEQFPLARAGRNLRVDGALVDTFKIPHGYWEAKDTKDDLEKEIQKKFEAGYPKDNILFQAPHRAIIYQDGREYFNQDISQPEQLVTALKTFFDYQPPHFEEWQTAVNEFKDKLPEHAAALLGLIRQEYRTNPRFIQAFDDFANLCRQALNPNLADAAVEEMIIQHILTERIFRKIFDNPDFVKRNIIAHEIDKVIEALTSQSFSREGFLTKLDRFYHAIEATAAAIDDYSQKQSFLNTVYERFFQGFSVKVADTHGIVYTPQPIVDFMVRSVDHLLRAEFGRSLGDAGVHILDPFVGTGNFIMRLMREIPKTRLDPKYAAELHCNEVMLLPYYIASMNIEHAYFEMTGTYKPFEGICLVDTFELAEAKTLTSLFIEANLGRVEQQRKTPIFVIIGNPPYNAGQVNENDNNKNRKYRVIDRRVKETYAKASHATLVRKYNDPYIKAIRYATDRIGPEGIIAFVTNHSFVVDPSFDGVRKYLEDDFDLIYILDLGGNVRKNPKLSGTTHNVFGIQPGVSINIFLKRGDPPKKNATIFYARTDEWWRKEEKYRFLEQADSIIGVAWEAIVPDGKHTWLTEGLQEDFEFLMPLGTMAGKRARETQTSTIFQTYSLGVSTNRDAVVYDLRKDTLLKRLQSFINDYNGEVYRYRQIIEECKKEFKPPPDTDDFVNYDKIQWSDTLKRHLLQGLSTNYSQEKIRISVYRPFTKNYLYYDSILNDRPGLFNKILPNTDSETDNHIICINQMAGKPFNCLITNLISDLHLCGGFGSQTQCFPFYAYAEDGSQRRENLTDWAWQEFRAHYHDDAIAKWDIFHYVYALLHHPAYREKYAANLRRELPRIPLAPDFWGFAKAGARLAELHVNYEQQPEYPLTWVEKAGAPLNWRVDKMKLTPDKTSLIYNNFLTLEGIPPEVFDYKLGNRSALEWVIDQYKVSTDPRSGITNDPNRQGDEQYITRLIGQVITVSLETLQIIQTLPALESM